MEYIHHYPSPLGEITMGSDGEALCGLWFDGQKYFPENLGGANRPLPVFDQADRWLDLYFSGARPDFTPPLRLRGTPFQILVWRLLLTVPYGQVVTYGYLARQAALALERPRMSAQAVGGAVGRNPISLIVPCHRVVGSGGALTGYAGGVDKKEWLLRLEKAR